MQKPIIPKNESARFKALQKYEILDTFPEKEYDDITQLASEICGTPISLISLLDDKRQWFKSHFGLDASETPKEFAFCAHAINDQDNLFVIPDSRKDNRFFDNPLVTDAPNVIFYAGIPLVDSEGYPLGTLCVIDNKPNSLNDFQKRALKTLSDQVIRLLEFRHTTTELRNRVYESEEKNIALERFTDMAAHDIKSPLSNMVGLAQLFKKQYKSNIDQKGIMILDHMQHSSEKLIHMVNGILAHSKNTSLLSEDKELVNVTDLIFSLFDMLEQKKHSVNYNISTDHDIEIYTNKVAIERIFLNLIDNSIKYNPQSVFIDISLKIIDNILHTTIQDDGVGILPQFYDKIFNLFETTTNKNCNGDKGTGIGLASVKSLVEGLGGEIHVIEVEKGACFKFTTPL